MWKLVGGFVMFNWSGPRERNYTLLHFIKFFLIDFLQMDHKK